MKKLLKIVAVVLIVFFALVVALFVAMSVLDSPTYAWRVLTMLWSDTGDIDRFAERAIEVGGVASPLPVEHAPVPETVTYLYQGSPRTENLQELIERTDTAAFVVIRDDKIAMQVYHDSEYSEPNTSFSVAKSFDSALIGAAIEDGFITSVNDPVTKYIPEIAGRGLDELTVRNLLRMDTGVRYRSESDILAPFSDDSLTYYAPDLRKLALGVQPSETAIGAAFHYNNYYPLLEGLVIERATGMPVAEYLEQRIWQPMGAEFPASWSLDSERSGFEKMESGINAAAADFARFGLLFLHDGAWNGRQILSESWVTESTAPDPTDVRPFETAPSWAEDGGYYGYHWWGMKNADGSYDFMARGNLGQLIYVAPRKNMVVVRFGPEPDDGVIWSFVVRSLIDQMP